LSRLHDQARVDESVLACAQWSCNDPAITPTPPTNALHVRWQHLRGVSHKLAACCFDVEDTCYHGRRRGWWHKGSISAISDWKTTPKTLERTLNSTKNTLIHANALSFLATSIHYRTLHDRVNTGTHPCCRAMRTKPKRFRKKATSLPGPISMHSWTPPGATATLCPSSNSLWKYARDAGRRSSHHQTCLMMGIMNTVLVATAWHDPTAGGSRSTRLLKTVGRAVGSTPWGSMPAQDGDFKPFAHERVCKSSSTAYQGTAKCLSKRR
jgi:hypothetical protein